MTAMALIKQGKKQEAGRLFAAIAKDKTVPEPSRARAQQIAGTLGVDAGAALDRTAIHRIKMTKPKHFRAALLIAAALAAERLQHPQAQDDENAGARRAHSRC